MAGNPIQVVYKGGVYLPEAELWLDPHGPKDRAFVSHAHADHVAPHKESICSATTRVIVEKRFSGRGEVLGHEFGEEFAIDGFRCVLLPAGHILGSAQLWIERIEDGESLLYTGDFKTRLGAACEPIEWRAADALIMETTFGVPKYRLPPTDEVIADIVRFLHETLEDGEVPMLAAYSLGKAQELIVAIHQAAPDLRFLFHSSVSRMTEIYGDFGYPLPKWETITKDSDFSGKVVVAPPSAIRSQQLRRVKKRATAMVSGWGIDPGAKFRYQVDHVFPLSDHADYEDLLDYVEKVDPKRVLTLHGFASEFASDVRERGIEAWSLIGSNQLELGFGGREKEKLASVSEELPPNGEFGAFARICEGIHQATGKLKKVGLLAKYFSELPSEALSLAAVFLTARPFARTEATRALQTGWAILRRSVLSASGMSEAQYREKTRGQNEPGRATLLVMEGRTQPEEFSLAEVREFFDQLAAARGPTEKSALLADQLARMHPREARFLVGILTGDLRIGLKEGLVEEALAKAFEVKTALLRRAHMLTGDLGETARLALNGELEAAQLTPFVPVAAMLASPEETADAIWDRLGSDAGKASERGVWLEDKFDGIRAQLHRVGERVEIYSRDLRPLTGEFAELVEPALDLPDDVILDGEIIAYAEGRKLSFFDLQKRLGKRTRTEGDLFLGASVPVRFVVFDVLWSGGESLIDRPLNERHEILQSLNLSDPFEAVHVEHAGSADEIEAAFKAARKRDNEGLIAKRRDSIYSPGRRGQSWLKLKKAMATLDCVVVKAEEGHGKRSHVLSDYTFSIRDTRTDELVVIGKAYSGLTDVEIEELTEHFQEHTISKKRRAHIVEPNIVLEIAFDSIQPSKRHSSGLSLRFPRIKAIRRDKTVSDIDTLAFARKLAGVK